jgi:hypothetical protein
MLIEALPMVTGVGAAVGAADFAFIYLRKNKNAPTESSLQQDSPQSQADLSITTPSAQDSSEPIVSAVAKPVAKKIQPEPSAITTHRPAELSPEEQAQLQTIRQMLAATTCPPPADSTLSRHYETTLAAKAQDCLQNEAKMARLVAEYEALQKTQAVSKSAVKVEILKNIAPAKCNIVPEDSMLKRHFLTQLRACIESSKAARPTDSALRRHYDAMINAEIDDYLASH